MPFLSTYSSLPNIFYSKATPQMFPKPECVMYNTPLAQELGLEKEYSQTIAEEILKGKIPKIISPLAQAYAGHQFGHFTMLWDGRALLVWEWETGEGKRYDIALKGSGPTPYSRWWDGKATLYSMLREYLISEAMHGLHIPTSRSLAVVKTGENIFRESIQDGWVVTRVISSHIRVGTFEFAKVFGKKEDLQALIDYTIARHYPEIQNAQNPAEELLKKVIDKQTDLIINWMRVGFIHGVMNTDNTSICSETFDYGPCAFINTYAPETVFSSIDVRGRYAFKNQRQIIAWNLWVFASTLSDFIDTKHLETVISELPEILEKKWLAMMGNKLGIEKVNPKDATLIVKLLDWMKLHKADYTNTFLYIWGNLWVPNAEIYKVHEFKEWLTQWQTRVSEQTGLMAWAIDRMHVYNPVYIPRNHLVEEALSSAVDGSMSKCNKLLEILKNPYEMQENTLEYMSFPNWFDENYATFCGT